MINSSYNSFGISVITVTLNQIDNLKYTISSVQNFIVQSTPLNLTHATDMRWDGFNISLKD